MTWYILPNSITKLFVSLSMLTTLSFDSEIVSYLYGGSKDEMFFELANKQKTLVMKGLKPGIKTNLMIVTKKRKYYFDVILNKKNPHKFIEVKPGRINKSYRLVESNERYNVFEGDTSQKVTFKKSKRILFRSKIDKGQPINSRVEIKQNVK